MGETVGRSNRFWWLAGCRGGGARREGRGKDEPKLSTWELRGRRYDSQKRSGMKERLMQEGGCSDGSSF